MMKDPLLQHNQRSQMESFVFILFSYLKLVMFPCFVLHDMYGPNDSLI